MDLYPGSPAAFLKTKCKETDLLLSIGLRSIIVLPSQHGMHLYMTQQILKAHGLSHTLLQQCLPTILLGLQKPQVRESEVWRPPGQLNLTQSSCPLSQRFQPQDSSEVSFLQGVSQWYVLQCDGMMRRLSGPMLRHPPLSPRGASHMAGLLRNEVYFEA